MKSNIVWTIFDWFDGPIIGVADFGNIHCIYEWIFDEELDDYTDNYYLTPISNDDFLLIMKDWERYLKWRKAFDEGERKLSEWEKPNIDLGDIAFKSKDYRKHTCRGEFIDCDYSDSRGNPTAGKVIWTCIIQ